MPDAIYTREHLIRDVVNTVSSAEGKPVHLGGKHHEEIDRAYILHLVSETVRAVDGHGVAAKKSKN